MTAMGTGTDAAPQPADWAFQEASLQLVSRTFALKDYDLGRTMIDTPYRRGVTGAPIIEGCLAYIDCRTYAKYEGGDHTIFLGEVQDTAVVDADGAPLLFFRGRYARLAEPSA